MSDRTAAATGAGGAGAANDSAKLARMAAQIAGFFAAYPEEQAVSSIAEHINQFWSWRMREDFLAAFAARDGELQPLVRKALPLVRGRHKPEPGV
jgi:formate dehydrogenase subunit delta